MEPQLESLGYAFNYTHLLLPPIAALIGWATNYIAVKMLFHPRTEHRLLGLSIQGVFPKRQKALAEKLGQLVSRELFSLQDVRQQMEGEEFERHVVRIIGEKVDTFLDEHLVRVMPMAGMFLGSDVAAQLKSSLIECLAKMAPDLGGLFIDHLEKNMDVEKLVRDKVEAFSSDKLEEMLHSIMKKEFKFIELVGAALGFMVGLAQLGILWLL